MLHEVRRSDRTHPYWATIDDIKEMVSDIMKDPPNYPLHLSVDCKWSFDSISERLPRKDINLHIESLLEALES
jgi:hypothetical protein